MNWYVLQPIVFSFHRHNVFFLTSVTDMWYIPSFDYLSFYLREIITLVKAQVLLIFPWPQKIKEVVGTVDNLTRFKKFTKAKASYVEYEKFADSNLHEGYFCYNCIYWITSVGGMYMLVENEGPDVRGKFSNVIAPHGCCSGYEPNYTSFLIQETRQKG